MNQRRGQRLKYPFNERPYFQVNSGQYEVIDMSENGMRFIYPLKTSTGTVVWGRIYFKCNESITLVGRISRIEREEVTILGQFPSDKIAKEMRHLRSQGYFLD